MRRVRVFRIARVVPVPVYASSARRRFPGQIDTRLARPPPRPYASVRPRASSAISRVSPSWAPTMSATGPRPFGGGRGRAAARSSWGSNCQQRCPCHAPPRRSRTSPLRVPTGASIPHAAPFDAVTTSIVAPIAPFSALSTEYVRTAFWSTCLLLTSFPTNAPSACGRTARGSGSAQEQARPGSTPAANEAAKSTMTQTPSAFTFRGTPPER